MASVAKSRDKGQLGLLFQRVFDLTPLVVIKAINEE